MSTTPKARHSNITGLTVVPDEWDSYPDISRSTITNCTFETLGASTNISRSIMSESRVIQEVESSPLASATTTGKEKAKKGAKIERSKIEASEVLNSANVQRSELSGCTVTESKVERSKLANCAVSAKSDIERTTAQNTKFIGAKSVQRSEFSQSLVLGGSSIERSVVSDSVVAQKSVVERTKLKDTVINSSRVERSNISDCDVRDCVIERTDFEGMILQYGIWKRGDLVGRTSNEHEVVIKPRPKPVSTKVETEASGPASLPAAIPRSGWKAAEAEREITGVESDPEEEDEEDSSPDELEVPSDGEALHPAWEKKEAKSQKQDSGEPSSTSNPFGVDVHDPPPPYEM